jgi:hypothetical protein
MEGYQVFNWTMSENHREQTGKTQGFARAFTIQLDPFGQNGADCVTYNKSTYQVNPQMPTGIEQVF